MKRNKSNTALIQASDITKMSLNGIKQEILSEQVEMVRDYVKGVYRLRNDIEKEILDRQKQIKKIDAVLVSVENGNIEDIRSISVPAKYLSEKTVRLNNMDWDE